MIMVKHMGMDRASKTMPQFTIQAPGGPGTSSDRSHWGLAPAEGVGVQGGTDGGGRQREEAGGRRGLS